MDVGNDEESTLGCETEPSSRGTLGGLSLGSVASGELSALVETLNLWGSGWTLMSLVLENEYLLCSEDMIGGERLASADADVRTDTGPGGKSTSGDSYSCSPSEAASFTSAALPLPFRLLFASATSFSSLSDWRDCEDQAISSITSGTSTRLPNASENLAAFSLILISSGGSTKLSAVSVIPVTPVTALSPLSLADLPLRVSRRRPKSMNEASVRYDFCDVLLVTSLSYSDLWGALMLGGVNRNTALRRGGPSPPLLVLLSASVFVLVEVEVAAAGPSSPSSLAFRAHTDPFLIITD